MRIYASIERTFKKRQDGLYQEFTTHFINIVDDQGNKTMRVDKVVPGGLFVEDNQRHSFKGEAVYTFEDDGVTRRLIGV